MTSKILLSGGCILTLGVKTPNLTHADVLIDDGVVAEVGFGLRARDAEQVDATDTIVMPGFVDTHRHTWTSLFRNLGEPASRGEASETDTVGDHYQPEDIYAATLIGLLGAAEAGITTVVDWSHVRSDRDFADAALQAHVDAGLRTVFVDTAQQGHEVAGPSTTIAFGSVLPGSTGLGGIAGEWALARESGLRIHAHAGSKSSGSGVISDAARQGILGEDVTVVHLSGLDEADIDAIAASGASVSLAPSSEMAGGLGSPPIQQLIDRDIRPGLGVDDERVAPGDMFAQMRAAISLQHATVFDLKLAGKAGLPRLMSTRDVIRHATVDGARAAGLGGVTGSLEPGMQADVIVLRTDRPNVFPINDPIGAVVLGHGHVERRLGVRAWACLDARWRPRNRCGTRPKPGDDGSTAGCRRLRSGRRRTRRRSMSATRAPSSALTSFVVASRYLPVYIAIALLVVVATIWAPATLSGPGLNAIAPFGTFLAITALGQMLVIMTGGIDLSVPGTLTLGAVVTVGIAQGHDDRMWFAIGVALALAALVGLVNGILIGGLGLNALIVTLAVGQIVSGIASRYYSTVAIQIPVPERLSTWTAVRFLGATRTFWMGVVITLALIVIFRFTTPGRRFQLVGANPTASWIAGLRVNLNQVSAYVVSAVLYGVAGILLASFLGTLSITFGAPYLLGPIAAVVIGGASLTGGLASPLSTWAAAFFLAGLDQMMRVMGLPTALQFVVFGLVIIGGMLVSGDRIIRGVEQLLRERKRPDVLNTDRQRSP